MRLWRVLAPAGKTGEEQRKQRAGRQYAGVNRLAARCSCHGGKDHWHDPQHKGQARFQADNAREYSCSDNFMRYGSANHSDVEIDRARETTVKRKEECVRPCACFNSIAHSAGLRVSAIAPDMLTATATVKANLP